MNLVTKIILIDYNIIVIIILKWIDVIKIDFKYDIWYDVSEWCRSNGNNVVRSESICENIYLYSRSFYIFGGKFSIFTIFQKFYQIFLFIVIFI